MTRFPCDLPSNEAPWLWWNVSAVLASGGDIDDGTAWIDMAVDTDGEEQAERRVLSYLDRNFEDDLRGSVATGTAASPGRFQVRLALARPR